MKADAAIFPSNALSITLNATFSAKDTLNLAKRNFFSKESPRANLDVRHALRRTKKRLHVSKNTPPTDALSRPTKYFTFTPDLLRARVRLDSRSRETVAAARPYAREGALSF